VEAESGRDTLAAEPRQRWRITFGRGTDAPPHTHREIADAWIAALRVSLPLPHSEAARQRPPLTFAAPLSVGMPAERELADLYLADRLAAWHVRAAIRAAAPAGINVADAHDVWLGSPPLAGSVAAADYRIVLAGEPSRDTQELRNAAAGLLAATTLERRRPRGTESIAYDLRPLLDAIEVLSADPPVLLVRTRFHPERGAGRPEEVVAALGDAMGTSLEIATTVRQRVLLADELAKIGLGRFDAPGG
jgi:radical SAM-linked protein